jgi:hypothetical protein
MPIPQSQIEWMLTNRAKILRYAFVPQFLAALVLFSIAYFTGKTDMHVLLTGARTNGKIVAFQPRELHTYRTPSSTGRYGRIVYLPIVEFQAQGTVVRFEEHKLVTTGESIGWPVAVLYDPSNVSLAMIDRSFWNWIPWAPALALGILLALAALKGLFSLALIQRGATLQTSEQHN